MSARFGSRLNKGFTLVEILIVVVILGILAAIVIPQFTSASEAAKASSLVSQLQTIRSQLEFYQIQHNGNYPTLTGDVDTAWQFMTGTTNAAGELSGSDFGPYLQQAPANPFSNRDVSTLVAEVEGATTELAGDPTAAGWAYNRTTGRIKALVPASVNIADLGLSSNDVIQGQ